ncbi:MAG TPA: NAD-dependent epimerase/dehydratase family protein, partial [Desulfuromonadaceae bacterium]
PPLPPAFDALRSRLRLAMADIRDEEKVERVVRDQEVIFNLAGKSGAADSNKTPLNDLDINCRGHLTVLEACRTFNPGVTIVFPSSRLVYGKPQYLPVDERHPLVPDSIYAAHKLAVENYHLIYGRLYGLKTTVLRISNPYGPFQAGEGRAYGIANAFIQAAVSGRPITLFGDGSQRRDYLYIDDLVEAMLCAASVPESRGRVYNIGDGHGTSLLELAELAVAAAGSGEIVRVPWPEEYRAIETGDYLSDITRARQELDWSPATGIRDGIARTVEFYRQ